MKKEQEQIDPNIIIDVATGLISDKPPTTFFGRVFRLIKRLNKAKNDLGIKIKKPS